MDPIQLMRSHALACLENALDLHNDVNRVQRPVLGARMTKPVLKASAFLHGRSGNALSYLTDFTHTHIWHEAGSSSPCIRGLDGGGSPVFLILIVLNCRPAVARLPHNDMVTGSLGGGVNGGTEGGGGGTREETGVSLGQGTG